jgi:hypothetical protein
MKYFTPERYAALQDFSTDAAMNAADADWEEAVQRYDAYYRSVENQLPRGMREIQSGYYLHDADVSNMGRQGDRFLIVLQLDTPPHDLLVFEYDLTGEPFIDEQALPEALRSRGTVEWLYDEVELLSTAPSLCTHSILLSNGWEVRLPFREVCVRQLSPVMPPRVARSPVTDHPSPFSHPPA